MASTSILMPGDATALTPSLRNALAIIDEHIKDGRFGRSLAFVASGSSFISGLEVAYEHYKGSYGNPIMYTPVALSFVLTAASGAAVFSRCAQEGAMRWASYITLIDGVIGFGFHVRGIARKPGGWRIPLTNIIMGPPIFAPLLFGTAAYLAVIASYLRREEDPHEISQEEWRKYSGWKRDLQEGRFQKHLSGVAAIWTILSGFEAWYSHYKSRFKIWSQWTPVIMTPIQFGVCIGAIFSERVAKTLLPASSGLALLNGTVGFGYHVRGVLRRSGGTKTWLYNILYGPPVFAPLLFAACGALGLLASVLRREK